MSTEHRAAARPTPSPDEVTADSTTHIHYGYTSHKQSQSAPTPPSLSLPFEDSAVGDLHTAANSEDNGSVKDDIDQDDLYHSQTQDASVQEKESKHINNKQQDAQVIVGSTTTTSKRKEVLVHPPQISDRESIFATNYIQNTTSTSDNNGESSPSSLNPSVDSHGMASQNVFGSGQLTPTDQDDWQASSRPQQDGAKKFTISPTLNSPPSPELSPTKDGVNALHFERRPTLAFRNARSQTSLLNIHHAANDGDKSSVEGVRSPHKTKQAPSPAEFKDGKSKDRKAQQIEVSIGPEEIVKNPRARKASHFMGLFKGEADEQERKALSKLVANKSASTNDLVVDRYEEQGNRPFQVPDESIASLLAADPFKEDKNARRDTVMSNLTSAQQDDRREKSEGVSFTQTMKSSQKETLQEQDISETNAESIEWRMPAPQPGTLPLRLLEEGRDRRTVKTSKPSPNEPNVSASAQLSSPSASAPALSSQADGIEQEEDEEEEDYDKEHIKSAVYIPHHIESSPEDFNTGRSASYKQETHLNHAQNEKADRYPIPQLLPEPALDANKYGPSKVSDTKPKSPADEYRQGLDWSSASSIASESETDLTDTTQETVDEEGDETEEEEGTLTPVPVAQHIRRATRTPVGAVELRPYKHQVGGHSKVFSFSKRAICKELNSRENLFYEAVERHHPELLTFLPKYLGVLNVTFQKKHKRVKAENKDTTDVSPNTAASRKPSDALSTSEISDAVKTQQETDARLVSRSEKFDPAADRVPQVVFANNLHIMPPTLVRKQSHLSDHHFRTRSSSRSSFHVTPMHQSAEKEEIATSSPDSPFSSKHEQWGATVVNTRLKERVFRDVFSPPPVHRHIAHQRSAHHHYSTSRRPPLARGSSHGNLGLPTQPLEARSLGSETAHEKKEHSLRRYTSEIGREEAVDEIEEGMQTPRPHQRHGSESHKHPAIERILHIGKRRSTSGLRRHILDMDTSQRSELQYFDDDKTGFNEAGDVFAIDMENPDDRPVSSGSSVSNDEDVSRSQNADQRPVSREQERVPTISRPLAPVNPLEAQQQNDERVQHFLLLEDLTASMHKPCVLDLKMGTRQYGIEADKKKKASQRQKCKSTTSRELGVRVCGMQIWLPKAQKYVFEDKYKGRDLRIGREFQDTLQRFLTGDNPADAALQHIRRLLHKLQELEQVVKALPRYRFYASSLLVLYDGAALRVPSPETSPELAGTSPSPVLRPNEPRRTAVRSNPISTIHIKLVDFANCITDEKPFDPDAPSPIHHPEEPDWGYIRGVKNLRKYLQQIWKEVQSDDWIERGEGEAMGIGLKGAGKSSIPDAWQHDWDALDEDYLSF